LILDTNALSAIAEAQPAVTAILARVQQVALPTIVLGEYRYGIAQSRQAARYRQWLDGLMASCTVLDVTQRTAEHYASIALELKRAGTPIPANDLWIAALAREHALPILSRDHHFDAVPNLKRLSW
jgi:tRNA(fMet)-specific endonuclease VapC